MSSCEYQLNYQNPKMRILSMHVMKWAQQNSLFLCSAYQLGFASWYQRPFLKDTVNFGARTACNRTKIGQTLVIHLPDVQAKCYIIVKNSLISFAVLADDQYPQRMAYMILKKLNNQFNLDFDSEQFKDVKIDQDIKWQKLGNYVKQFQDPKEVDKLQKLKDQLKQVEDVVHKNLQDLMKRGENLDRLMENSKDLNKMSLDFYKNAKKVNKRCCSLY